MNDLDGLIRVEKALNRYSSFRSFAKKVSRPVVGSPVLDSDWKPFYAKNMSPTLSVRLNPGQTAEILGLREKFAQSRFDTYSKLVSNFYDADCGCEGTDS